jgi:hypothetical protein
MAKFTKKQRAEAEQTLGGKHDPTPHVQAWSPAGPWVEHGSPQENSSALFQQLRAKVIDGSFRVDEAQNDWQVAKTNLTADEQAELKALLGWDD